MRAKTKLIHGIRIGEPSTGSVNVPIYQTSTYKQEAVGKHQGYEYSRTGNPTRAALEEMIAVLENGHAGFAFGSGMAAITLAILNIAGAGDEIISDSNLYGGTYNLFAKTLPKYGITVKFVDGTKPEEIEKAITELKPEHKVALLAPDSFKEINADYYFSFGNAQDLEQMSASLYDALRACDKTDATIILATATSKTGVGTAIMNRLEKAAGGKWYSL